MKILWTIIAIILIPILISSCGGSEPTLGGDIDTPISKWIKLFGDAPDWGIYYLHDEEHGVGIWIYDRYKGGGIAVLPDTEYLR